MSRCVPVSAADFASRYWDTAPLLGTGLDSGRYADLFSLDDVDQVVSAHGLRTPFLRMAKNGTVLPATDFTRGGGLGAGIADQVADDKVLAQLADGATLVLQGLHRTWPPLIELGGRLAAELGHPVQINAYITPPQNQGFAAHYDTHDVFVLQVAGSKQWRIHEPVLARPLPDQPWEQRRAEVAAAAVRPPLIDATLRPGDALYLPRGYLHSAVAQGAVSVHLTIGVHPITGHDLAHRLLEVLARDPELRRSLPIGPAATEIPALTTHVAASAMRLGDAVGRADSGDFRRIAEQVARRLAADTRPAPVPPLAQLAAIAALAPTTALRLRPGLRPRLRPAGDRVAVDLIDSEVSFPGTTDAALAAVLTGESVRPIDLPGLDPDEQLVLGRRLLREGVVVPVAASPPAGG